MSKFAILALLAVLVGWVLTGMTSMHLLSGPFEQRTCQTACVQGYFFAAMVACFTGVAMSLLGMFKASGRKLSVAALVLSLPLCGLFGALFYSGNYI